MIALLVGCAQEQAPAQQPVTQQPPAQQPPAAPQEPAAPPVEEAPAEPAEEEPAEEEKQMIQPDQEQIDRLRTACENGAVKLCIALKTQYGIEAQPLSKEPETTEETTEEATE